ncbi:hypothetical protein Plhal304r1_c006g0024031 [Plasmopara halstedii]
MAKMAKEQVCQKETNSTEIEFLRGYFIKPEERADNQAKAENDYDRAGDAKSPLDHVIPLAVSPMDPFGVAERLIPCRQE